MTDPLARNDWIGPREDRWTDILPPSWQSAINTSPTVTALQRFLTRPSFDEYVKNWQDSIPGNSPVDRIAEGRGTVASEYPNPMSPFLSDVLDNGGLLANFVAPGGVRLPPQGANSWRFPSARIPEKYTEVPQHGVPAPAPTDNGMIRAYHGSPASFDKFVTPAFFARDEMMAQAYKREGGGDNLNGLWKPSSGTDGHMYEVSIPKPTKYFDDFERQAALLDQAKREGHKVVAFGNPKQPSVQELAVLDPSMITILRKYGLLPPVAAGAANAVTQGQDQQF